jgi:hypothetical protein
MSYAAPRFSQRYLPKSSCLRQNVGVSPFSRSILENSSVSDGLGNALRLSFYPEIQQLPSMAALGEP